MNKFNYAILTIIAFSFNVAACESGEFYAFSPYKVDCREYSNTCDIPEGFITTKSCDLKSNSDDMKLPTNMSEIVDQMKRLKEFTKQNGSLNIEQMQGVAPGFFGGDQQGSKSQVAPGGMNFYMQNNGK